MACLCVSMGAVQWCWAVNTTVTCTRSFPATRGILGGRGENFWRRMDFPGKNTGVGSHFLLQGLFATQGSNPGVLCCRQIPYHLSHKGSPRCPYKRQKRRQREKRRLQEDVGRDQSDAARGSPWGSGVQAQEPLEPAEAARGRRDSPPRACRMSVPFVPYK